MKILSVGRHVWTHPSNRRQRVRALSRAVRWQLTKRLTGRSIDYDLPSGLRLRVHPDSAAASSVLYSSGLPDHAEMAFAAEYLRAGDNFVDVGANIGSYVLFVAPLIGKRGRIVAFEPGEVAHRRLSENVTINGLDSRVELRREAAAAENGTARFSNDRDTQNALSEDGSGVEVATVRLDDAVHGQFALGKLDLEGAEPMALEGARRLLFSADPPVWLLEINRVALRRFGSDEERLADQLAQSGFDLFTYDPDERVLTRLARPLAPHHANVIAVSRARREEILERLEGVSLAQEGDGPGSGRRAG